MLFDAATNSTLALAGLIILGAFLLIIALSLIIIAWDTARKNSRQHSRYLEFDPTELERENSLNSHHRVAKGTLVCYGLGIFCQYVCSSPVLLM
jgi:hypothetical protein